MEKIAIPEDLWPEVKIILTDIEAARAGLDHFSVTLRDHQIRLWKMIEEALPELEPYHLRLDKPAKELIKTGRK